MDSYKIDTHKLTYHPEWLARWRRAMMSGDWNDLKKIYPLYIEVTPSGACNHRCIFCAFDYIGYKKRFLDVNVFKKRLKEIAKLGVRSILYGGEGEPLLHKDIAEIISSTKEVGIDVALTPNGVLLSELLLKEILKHLSWIKVSVDAGTPATYAKVHGTKEEDFAKVLENLKTAVWIKKEKNYKCAIGAQMLLLPENADEVVSLASQMKEIGVDYLVIKPFSQHKFSRSRRFESLRYAEYYYLAEELEKFNDANFEVIFRIRTMQKLDENKKLQYCGATPFLWAHIMSSGDVYSCSAFLGDKRFFLGNIYQRTFKGIWQGDLRKRHIEFIRKFDVFNECRYNCRMHECNIFLWDLLHPTRHVNFI